MLTRLRSHIGTAGLVVAIVALIAALGGGAYAASGGSGGGKATASAKGKQGKQGKPGKTGPAGPAGAPGAKGDTGAAGANGANGANGVSVVSTPIPANPGNANCKLGGTEFKAGSAIPTFACNGEKGSEGDPGEPWTAGGVLPSGATETGTWGGVAAGEIGMFPISIPIPLAEDPEAILIKPGESKVGCPGLDTEGTPQAEPGKLCVYGGTFGGTVEELGFLDPSGQFVPGSAPPGTVLSYQCGTGECITYGTWAVTAD
jgi:hypothetical protein